MKMAILLFGVFLLSGCMSVKDDCIIHEDRLILKNGLERGEVARQLETIGFTESLFYFRGIPLNLDDGTWNVTTVEIDEKIEIPRQIKISKNQKEKMEELDRLLAERDGANYDIVLYDYLNNEIDCGVLVEFEVFDDGSQKLKRYSVMKPEVLCSVNKMYREYEELKLLKKGNKLLTNDIMNTIKSLPVSH